MPPQIFPLDPAEGPYLDVFISKPLSVYSEDDVERSREKVNMLIDTGASKTAINSKIAYRMGLQPQGKRKMIFATSKVTVNLYYIDLECTLPYIYIPDFEVVGFELTSDWRDGFLGRDFLQNMALEVNGPEKYFKITV